MLDPPARGTAGHQPPTLSQPIGSSIWALTREESEKGRQRTSLTPERTPLSPPHPHVQNELLATYGTGNPWGPWDSKPLQPLPQQVQQFGSGWNSGFGHKPS